MNELFPQQPTVYEQIQENATAGLLNIDARKAILTLGAVASLGIMSSSESLVNHANASPSPKHTAIENPLGSTKSEMGIYLRDVSELEGFGMKVSREKRINLEDSAIKILKKLKNPGGYDVGVWQEACTGNVIKIPGYKGSEIIVSTASHCDDSIGPKSGASYNPALPAFVDPSANSLYEFAIADPKESPEDRELTQIGYVEGMTASKRNLDMALLRIRPNDERQPGQKARLLRDIKPFVYRVPKKEPLQGQQVAISSVPSASGNKLGSTVGQYFGKHYMLSEEGKVRPISIVGINTASADDDKCNFGASGSSAVLADGTTLGPLSVRLNSGYYDGTVQYDDVYYYSKEGKLLTYNSGQFKAIIERTMGVDLQNYPTLCGFTVPLRTTMKNAMKGFTHVIPPNAKMTDPTEPSGFKGGVYQSGTDPVNQDPVGFISNK